MNPGGSWTLAAKWACIQLKLKWDKKREKRRKYHIFSPFSIGLNIGRELEREMRETPHSLYDLRRSGGRNLSSQDLKFIYSIRATHG